MWKRILAVAAASALAASATSAPPSLLRAPTALLVESLAEPFAEGVDAPAPRFSWTLAPAAPGARGVAQAAFELELYLGAAPPGATPFFASGKVASPATSLVSPPGMPAPLPASARVWWRVRVYDDGNSSTPSDWSASASFTTGLAQASWGGGWVCGARGAENVFRATFSLPAATAAANVSLALVHVAGLGVHNVRFNGAPAGGIGSLRKLDGGWTSYAHRVLYTTHDVTSALVPGENVLGVSLGGSWFNSASWYARPPYGWPSATNGGGFSYAAPPLLRVQLVLRLANGSEVRIASSADGSGGAAFSATRGPVLFDSLYDGEDFDGARAAALAGWDAPDFAPAPGDWLPVVAADNATVNPVLGAALSAQPFEPTVRLSSSPPLASWSPRDGVTVYDFGANTVGNVRWTFRGLAAGTNVTMRYAEVLRHPPYGAADGTLYFDNLRNAHATDTYLADGSEGVEVFEPSFTWHGFRFAQVSSSSAFFTPPALGDVALVRQANSVEPGAEVTFSAPLLNAVQAMATSTIFANFQGGPGSCGQRDERQFFTGDTGVTAETVMLNARCRALYAAWAITGADDQNADGSIGFYLPTPITDQRNGSPQWSTGFLTVVHLLMTLEGDVASCRAVYSAVQKYIAFNEGQYAAAVTQCGSLSCYWPAWPAEWQQVGPDPDPSLMNAFGYVNDLLMASDVAAGLGESADAAAFAARAAARTVEFRAAFFNASTACFGACTQSELSVALALNATASADEAAAVFAQLLRVTEAAGTKQLTGIVGQRFFYKVLAQFGRADVGVRILLDDTFPSFGFMLQGADNPEPASTLWEIWSAYNGDPIMSSRNHLMFASYSAFLLRLAVGVSPLGLGYADGVLVWPLGLGLLNSSAQALLPYAAGSMTTPRGEVRVAWTTVAPAPPPAAETTCGESAEAPAPAFNYVRVGCDIEGGVIASVVFADFGTSTGACGGVPFAVDSACSAKNTSSVVAAACVGRRNCSVAADIREFGDPCEGTAKHLALNVTCTSAPPPPPPSARLIFLGSLSVEVPVGLPATLRFQSFGLASPSALVITEGAGGDAAPAVWRGGAFAPGVAGVVGAAVAPAVGPAGAFFVDVSVLSGAFAFAAWAAAP
jgi:alpha-L-rhamnosidase